VISRARRRIPPGELDAGCLANHAAAAIAPDEILRPERLTVEERDVDAAFVLRETCQLASTIDRHRQLADPLGQDALDVVLPQREAVVVPGGKVADVQGDHVEALDVSNLSCERNPVNARAFTNEVEDVYARAYSTPGALRAGFEYYRRIQMGSVLYFTCRRAV
jgi:hypothetical protein